jgi:hypothetical protein
MSRINRIILSGIVIILSLTLPSLGTNHLMHEALAQPATSANTSSSLGNPFYTEQFKILSGPGSPSVMNSSGETPAVQFIYKGNVSIGGTNLTDSGQYVITFASTAGIANYKSPEYQRGQGIINASDGVRAHYIFQAIGYTHDKGTKHTYNGILVFIDTPSVGKLAVFNTPSNLFRMNFELNGGTGTISVWPWR